MEENKFEELYAMLDASRAIVTAFARMVRRAANTLRELNRRLDELSERATRLASEFTGSDDPADLTQVKSLAALLDAVNELPKGQPFTISGTQGRWLMDRLPLAVTEGGDDHLLGRPFTVDKAASCRCGGCE